jgi:filamentous hemagglutinin
MAVTRIKNNQITDASNGNAQLGVNAAVKLQNYTITSAKIANNLIYGSDLTVTGNLTVQGNTTTIDTTITTIEDPVIVLASNQTSGAPTVDIGFLGYRGSSSNIAFVWDESADEFVTVFTDSTAVNTVVTITSYANFHTNDANIGGNIVINGTTSLVGNLASANVTGNITGGNLLTAGLVSATGNVTGGNITTGGLITSTGNVTGGNLLTGGLISATSTITSAANITGGNLLTGGLISATATITGGNIATDGTVSATGNVTGGNVLTGGLISATSTITSAANITGGNVLTGGIVSATSTITGGNVATGGTVSATGNVTGGNVLTGGLISATGNITGGNIISGNAVIGNINVSGNITVNSLTSNTFVSATGNVIGGNVSTAGLVTAAGNVTGGNLLTAGLISATSTITSAANITGGNLLTGGVVSATANITGGNVLTGGVVSATSNVTGGNVLTSGLISATSTITSAANITGGNILTSGLISATGDVTANNVNTDNVISSAGLTLTASNGDIILDPSGNINASASYINNVADPVQAQDAATKEYVDNAVSTGITIHEPVRVESPVDIGGTYAQGGTTATVTSTVAGNTVVFGSAISPQVNDQYWFSNSFNGVVANTPYFVVSAPNTSAAVLSLTYSGAPVTTITSGSGLTQGVRINSGQGATLTNNGANAVLVIDGVTVANTDRVLVYTQANAVHNGVYVVSEAGNATTAWQLTRSSDMDTYIPDDINGLDAGDYFYVQDGDSGAGESYVMTAPIGPTIIGFANLTFTQFSASQVYTANTNAGLSLTGTVFSAKVDNNTTAFDGGGNIIVKAGANLTTPNIGAATGTSLSATGNVTGGNVLTGGLISATANITGGNVLTGGLISATANITGGNLLTGGLISATSTITSAANITGGNILTSGLISATSTITSAANITGGNILTAGLISATANVTGGNLLTAGLISATSTITSAANITGGNILTAGLISATGNVTGGNILSGGSGSFTGNVTAPNFIGNISGNIDAGGANTNIQFNDGDILAGSPGFTFDKVGNVVTANGNITGANISTAGVVTATGNVTGGNVLTGGLISATSTITSAANITGGNVLTGGLISATSTITSAANVIGGNITTAGLVTATGNVTGGNVTTAGLITATGNITGADLILTSGTIDGPAAGRITINGSDIDTDFAVDGDTVANVFYVDAGTGTASFGASTQVTNAIVNFATTTSIKVPVGNTSQRPDTGVTGMVRFNTTNNNIEVYDNATWVAVGAPVFTVIADQQFAGNDVATVFTLSSSQTTNSCIVSINGVIQIPTLAYSVSDTTLTFTEAPALGDVIDVRQITTTTTVTSIANSSGNAVVSVSPTSAQVDVTGDLSVSGSILGGNINSTAITNGTSNVSVVSSGGNVATSVGGTANVMVVSSTDVTITGNLTVTGNATLSGNILGDRIQNGTTQIDIQTTGGNANITIGGTSNTAVFSNTALTLATPLLPSANITYDLGSTSQRWKDLWLSNSTIYLGNAQISANATALILTNPSGGQTVLSGATPGISVTGNVTGGNITTGGVISATGNITGGNLSGTNITGTLLTASQTNITAVGTLTSLNSGAISSSGNVTGANFLTAGLISATGAITGAALTGTSLTVSTGNITGGNLLLSGAILDSAQLDIQTTASNANIALAPNGTGVVTVSTQLSAVGNVTGGNIRTAGLISATGQVTGSQFNGSGAGLTSIPNSALSNTTVTVNGTAIALGGSGTVTANAATLTGTVLNSPVITSSLTSVGALNSGSITSGFGTIDIGVDTVTCGGIINANANGVGNIGSTGTRFNQVFALASSAQYADLAEKYVADADYAPGTVVVFGGTAEVTVNAADADRRVAGVVSTNPAYIMNDGLAAEFVAAVALTGRVPCLVTGPVRKGDLMVAAGLGRARAEADPKVGTVIGKALADHDGESGTIEVVVGRF